MRKFLLLLVIITVLCGIMGKASGASYFQDGDLIRVVYQMSGQYEVDTDLGPFSPTTPYSGAAVTLNAAGTLFPPAGSGAFANATWAKMQVAYFINDSTHMFAWTSGPAAGQKNGNRQSGQFEGAADLLYAGAISTANGTAQATQKQSGEQSYVTLMDNGNPGDSAGYFAGFLPNQDGEETLGALGSGASYVDSYLYYYATPDSSLSGVQVADIRTYPDGHSEIDAVGNAPVVTHFSVSAPSAATTGTPVSITVKALDGGNNLVAGYAGTVHFTSSDTAATLPADATLTGGTGTFSVTFNTAGNQTVTATDTQTSAITGTSGTINVSASTSPHFTVSAPSTATIGIPIAVTVTAKDASNNTLTTYTGAVHFSGTDAKAALPADATLTGGTGTFQVTFNTAGNQTITATDKTNPTMTGTSGSITASYIHFTVSAPSLAGTGAAVTVTVTAKDASSNALTTYMGAVHFTSTDAKAVLPADTTLTGGTGTFQVTFNTTGSQTITVTDKASSNITGASGAITVGVVGAATQFKVSAASPEAPGVAFTLTVSALDFEGNAAAAYTGAVHFTSTDAKAALPADTTLTGGTGTFQVTFNTPGSQTITASDTTTASISGTSGAILVGTAGVATKLAVSAPSSATAGKAVNFTVSALDFLGNAVTAYTGPVHFTGTDPAETLPPDSTLAGGTGTFQVTFNTTGSQTITASDTTTASISGTSGTINVVPLVIGPTSQLKVTAPASVVVGKAFNFTVTALDASGNVTPAYNGTVQFVSTDPAASLPAKNTLPAGARTFSATLRTAGEQLITVTDAKTSSITGVSGTITAGTVTHFKVSATSPAIAGSVCNFTVTALDKSNNVVFDYAGTVHFTSTDPAAALPADSTLTKGMGTFQATLNTTGKWTISAIDTAASSITGTSNTVAVSTAPATHYKISAPSSAMGGAVFSFTVTALDASGNTATSYTGKVHFTSTDRTAVLPADSTLIAGTGAFSAILNAAGNQTITASDKATSAISGSTDPIAVTATTHLEVSAPNSVMGGAVFTVTVTALDDAGDTMSSYSGVVHFTSTDSAAKLPADSTLINGTGSFSATLSTKGNQTITATDKTTSAITGTTAPISVGPTIHFRITAPTTVTAGEDFNFKVKAVTQSNKKDTSYSGTVQFTSSDPEAKLPADAKLTNGSGEFSARMKTAGTRVITATDEDIPSEKGSTNAITVLAAKVTDFALSSQNTTIAGKALSFTINAEDRFGNPATSYSGTVHFSSSDPAAKLPADATLTSGGGKFTAKLKTTGSRTITAVDTADSSVTGATDAIAVGDAGATHFKISVPASAISGDALIFKMSARDKFNNIAASYSGTVHFSSTDPTASLPDDSTLTNGAGTFSATLVTSGNQTITASDAATASTITGKSKKIAVSP